MGHNHRVHLFVCDGSLIPTGIETAGIDFPGNLLGLHTVARTGQEIDYGFFEFHSVRRGKRIPLFRLLVIVGVVNALHKRFAVANLVGEGAGEKGLDGCGINYTTAHRFQIGILVYPAPVHTFLE